MNRKYSFPSGTKFGKLTIIKEAGCNQHREMTWLCKCECGRDAIYRSSALMRGKALTCGKCSFGYYSFCGETATCVLPGGIAFTIDRGDFPVVSQYRWNITTSGYLTAFIGGKKTYLHYLLMPRRKGLLCDHINHDKLDNRRENLRYATPTENIRHKRVQSNNTSGYIGVCLAPDKRLYRAYFKYQGKQKRIGLFETAEDAARARDKAVARYYGGFAVLNFPMEALEHA